LSKSTAASHRPHARSAACSRITAACSSSRISGDGIAGARAIVTSTCVKARAVGTNDAEQLGIAPIRR
jgi:hypothetical protein